MTIIVQHDVKYWASGQGSTSQETIWYNYSIAKETNNCLALPVRIDTNDQQMAIVFLQKATATSQ